MTKVFDEYIKCLDERRYFDAHESIESIWFPRRFDNCDEVRLLKGFINAAVSFELHKQSKIEASKKVYLNYLKYRPLLYKIDSIHLNKYQNIAQHIEKIQTYIQLGYKK